MITISKVKLTQRSKGSPSKGSQSSAEPLNLEKFNFVTTIRYNHFPGRENNSNNG